MKLLELMSLKFNEIIWKHFPELLVIDTILENRIDIFKIFEKDIIKDLKNNNLGRKDSPSVEQIVRAIIYKESRGITYEELELQQYDSIVCKEFIKLNKKAFSDSMYQGYVKKINPETIKKMMIEINKLVIEFGYEDVKDVRIDATAIETNIHYPTNNSLMFDCLKTGTHILKKLTEKHSLEYNRLVYRLIDVKKNYYNLNNIKIDEKDKEEKKRKRAELIKKLFEENLNFLQNLLEDIKKYLQDDLIKLSNNQIYTLNNLVKQIEKIYKNAWDFQIEGKPINVSEKIFSIYEEHTDIIVKGLQDWIFGHKVNIASGKSYLILDYEVCRGNPSDSNLFATPLKNIQDVYNKQIESVAADGCYASAANITLANKVLNIKNIVFGKIKVGMENIFETKEKEKWLKNFRAGAEVVISNLKRGFDLVRIDWKGFEMFESKVAWGILGYNFRIITKHIMNTLFPKQLQV